MTDEQFEENYPKDKYRYIRTRSRNRGHLGQTEIEHYEIIDLATGDVILKPTRTEHTNVRGLITIVKWDLK